MTTQDELEFARSNALLTARIMRSAGFTVNIGHNGTTLLLTRDKRNIGIREVLHVIYQEELPIDQSQLTIFPGAVLIDLSEV